MENNLSAREAYNAYLRAWRKKNPEKVKAAKQRYWEKKARMQAETNQNQTGTAPEKSLE